VVAVVIAVRSAQRVVMCQLRWKSVQAWKIPGVLEKRENVLPEEDVESDITSSPYSFRMPSGLFHSSQHLTSPVCIRNIKQKPVLGVSPLTVLCLFSLSIKCTMFKQIRPIRPVSHTCWCISLWRETSC